MALLLHAQETKNADNRDDYMPASAYRDNMLPRFTSFTIGFSASLKPSSMERTSEPDFCRVLQIQLYPKNGGFVNSF